MTDKGSIPYTIVQHSSQTVHRLDKFPSRNPWFSSITYAIVYHCSKPVSNWQVYRRILRPRMIYSPLKIGIEIVFIIIGWNWIRMFPIDSLDQINSALSNKVVTSS